MIGPVVDMIGCLRFMIGLAADMIGRPSFMISLAVVMIGRPSFMIGRSEFIIGLAIIMIDFLFSCCNNKKDAGLDTRRPLFHCPIDSLISSALSSISCGTLILSISLILLMSAFTF